MFSIFIITYIWYTLSILCLFQSYYINQVGGTCVKNFVKRVFTKLFTNELATKFSWMGFRQNQALQNLKIVNIIKGNLTKLIFLFLKDTSY